MMKCFFYSSFGWNFYKKPEKKLTLLCQISSEHLDNDFGVEELDYHHLQSNLEYYK